jgi:ABC-2 type transport system ATP-binding protein
VLLVDDLHKTYPPASRLLRPFLRAATTEPVDALRGVSLSVAPGEVVGLVGPNGAGKTTLLKIIATLLEPTRGRVEVDGYDVVRQPHRVRGRIGLVLAEDRGMYWRLSGQANLEFFGVLAGLPRDVARGRATELLEQLDLAGRDKLLFGYSSGMRARLNIARALLAEPPLLVLDEPTRSLDPLASGLLGDLLRELASGGRAVLLSSHRLDEVAAVCDRVVVMLDGRVRYDGSTAAVAAGEGVARGLTDLLASGGAPDPAPSDGPVPR